VPGDRPGLVPGDRPGRDLRSIPLDAGIDSDSGSIRRDGGGPRVVVGVDGSPGSRAALVHAFTTGAQRGAELEVVSSYPMHLGRHGVAVGIGGAALHDPRVDPQRSKSTEGDTASEPAMAEL
jgi:hypothetical protein